jgi:hypothetical protein
MTMDRRGQQARLLAAAVPALLALFPANVSANAGPFVVWSPGGDPSAKGVLAHIDPSLRPAREERLRVVKEDLEIGFGTNVPSEPLRDSPLARVTARYQVENPTDRELVVDFGFPVLRAMAGAQLANGLAPDASVKVDDEWVEMDLFVPGTIYGLIRRSARAVIEKAVARDPELSALTSALRALGQNGRTGEVAELRMRLAQHLKTRWRWTERDVDLFFEYARLDWKWEGKLPDESESDRWLDAAALREVPREHLGTLLAAIGEQKGTQFLTHLARLLDSQEVTDYEALFQAWGGDVRERAVDLRTGEARLRRDSKRLAKETGATTDATIYARVDYLDAAYLNEAERRSCQTILKNLPVTFTFAPMNLLHYRVTFAPKSTRVITVAYSQYAYADTGPPASYQIAYVVHPASLWKDFGPIHLTIRAPEATPVRASVACGKSQVDEREMSLRRGSDSKPQKTRATITECTVTDKTGELFVGLDADEWERLVGVQRR